MLLFDRYTGKTVSEIELPNQIDFGRYYFIDTKKDITYSNFPTNKVIKQDLLLDKNKNIQDILLDIAVDVKKANDFEVIPLIRRIKNKLDLNLFEKLLLAKIFHVEEIFRAPHYLLHREIEKVHVSRAKRIPSKSYQYLASHTEDWVHKSIVSFKPRRILNEELELNFDVYENQISVALVRRSLVYLSSRLKEIQDIRSFFTEYEKLLKNRNDQNGWYKKTERNLELIGAVYEDENYRCFKNDDATLSETEKILKQIQKRLLLLQKTELFDLVNKRAIQSIYLKNTNVLDSHKHYRYVKILWTELNKIRPEKSEEEKYELEQQISKALRDYAKSLIIYALKKNLNYKIYGCYSNYKAEHLENFQLCQVSFKENKNGIFEMCIGDKQLNIVVIGNLPDCDEKLLKVLKEQNLYLLYFDENPISKNGRLIPINPLDPDSVERIATLIRKYILLDYLSNINKHYKFKQLLRDYVKYIPNQFITFNEKNFTYSFHSFPNTKLSFKGIRIKVENDQNFKSKSVFKPDKENIIKCLEELIEEIDKNETKLKNDFLVCLNCGENLHAFNNDKLNYLKCNECSCLIDSSKSGLITLKIDDEKYSHLEGADFGMDNINFNTSE